MATPAPFEADDYDDVSEAEDEEPAPLSALDDAVDAVDFLADEVEAGEPAQDSAAEAVEMAITAEEASTETADPEGAVLPTIAPGIFKLSAIFGHERDRRLPRAKELPPATALSEPPPSSVDAFLRPREDEAVETDPWAAVEDRLTGSRAAAAAPQAAPQAGAEEAGAEAEAGAEEAEAEAQGDAAAEADPPPPSGRQPRSGARSGRRPVARRSSSRGEAAAGRAAGGSGDGMTGWPASADCSRPARSARVFHDCPGSSAARGGPPSSVSTHWPMRSSYMRSEAAVLRLSESLREE